MWEWITANHGVISAFANVLMLLVWVSYLHLFYLGYRHQLCPKVLINRAGGRTIRSRCIVTNMNSETIYVEVVILDMKANDRTIRAFLSDIDRLALGDSEQRPDTRSNLFQGPLESGGYLDLGTFADLTQIALKENPDETVQFKDLDEIEITILGTHTWSDIVAAKRTFAVETRNGEQMLKARFGSTKQITSLLEQRRYKRFLEEHNVS